MLVLVDDALASDFLTARGFVVEAFDAYDFSKANDSPVLVVATNISCIPKLHALWGEAATPFCHLALAKFDASLESLGYALDQLLSVNHAEALARRSARYEQLFSSSQVDVRTGNSVLHVHVGDEVEVANGGTTIEPGVLYSAFEFFEASVVNIEGERSTFWVEGTLEFDALIHLSNNAEQKMRYGSELDDLVRRASSNKNVLEFVDNKLSRIRFGGEDVTASFLSMMVEDRGTSATEMGFGCADFCLPEDLRTNSVLHKARQGVYVGIGKGQLVPHVDFVAKGAEITFVGAE
jgi:hypothetical protein